MQGRLQYKELSGKYKWNTISYTEKLLNNVQPFIYK